MPLTPGARIGSNEIVAPLGTGGMREVYRARDTSLGRGIAVKVIPQDLAGDAERLAALERAVALGANPAGVGDLEGAIDCLERAFERGSGPGYGLKASFLFEPLRDYPRFKTLLGRMNLP